MDVGSLKLQLESETHTTPLLMEHSRPETINSDEHVIDITGIGAASSSSLLQGRYLDATQQDGHSSTPPAPISPPLILSSTSSGSNSRNTSVARRGETRRRRSPLNSDLWISIELVITVCQIVASIVVLSLSRDEHPHTPLNTWIIGYASGCVVALPFLYWRYRHRNEASEQDSTQARRNSQLSRGPFSLSLSRASGEDLQTAAAAHISNQSSAVLRRRVKVLVEYFKLALDCLFAVWFVVGNVWIFGGHSSADVAPNLYRLCIVFLTFSCIGYAMPFILCATICCCLPCIISVLGFREDLAQARGATTESIDALPTYKFKMKKTRNGDSNDGVVGAGTEKERVISGDDAVCCICLSKYANNDELRELTCSHFFHKECVDKWLKINASCPLCKSEVGESLLGSLSSLSGSQQQRSESRVGNNEVVEVNSPTPSFRLWT